MAKYKLTDSHPLAQRLEKVMALANELNLRIDFSVPYRTWITDLEDGKEYELEDVDSGDSIHDFPAITEYKIVYEKNQPPPVKG